MDEVEHVLHRIRQLYSIVVEVEDHFPGRRFTPDGRFTGLRSEPEHLWVLRILPSGEAEEVYSGPGKPAWDHAGKVQKNGQRPVSVSRLIKLMNNVPGSDRLPGVAL